MPVLGNLYDIASLNPRDEQFCTLVAAQNLKIERIVSNGQASAPGVWFDQELAEWVLVLAGSAALRFEGETGERVLRAGDHLLIPARQKHRVEWTDQAAATIWLAAHFRE